MMEQKNKKQFEAMKRKHADKVLWFRTGDYFEVYNEDAEKCAKVLGIPAQAKDGWEYLTSFHLCMLDTYLPKMIRAGFRIAICVELKK